MDTPTEQLRPVLAALRAVGQGATVPAVSGDVAADLVAPWRQPAQLVIYTRTGTDLAVAGLTPATGPEDATAVLIVAADVGITAVAPAVAASGVRLADGMQVLYDLYRSPGTDADEAADRWRTRLRERSRTRERD